MQVFHYTPGAVHPIHDVLKDDGLFFLLTRDKSWPGAHDRLCMRSISCPRDDWPKWQKIAYAEGYNLGELS